MTKSLQDIGATVVKIESAKWLDEDHTVAEVMVELSVFDGEVFPFVVSANYDTTHGKEVWDKIQSEDIDVLDWQPPTQEELDKIEEENRERIFESERRIALRIEEDYRLGLEDISDEEFIEVKSYIRSIKPGNSNTYPDVKRPEIFIKYM